ncbi:MAG: glycosyltransferase [Desulfobulbaceae bacterium]|nr:MAG: glycosyltransferase [Desulfobulbaceae bacterium]
MIEKQKNISAIIVTHNSEGLIDKCVDALQKQSYPLDRIIIIDSGSTNSEYLDDYESKPGIIIKRCENIGYSRANNEGYQLIPDETEFILFLNPDTFLGGDNVATALRKFAESKQTGVITGTLLAYEIATDSPGDTYDSTGIFRAWYGRWYDRDQGKSQTEVQYYRDERIHAACGAMMFIRCAAVEQYRPEIFHADFFLYKEDIELSLRLSKTGWNIIFSPEISAYHCRGWDGRKKMSRYLKLQAARNEVLLYQIHPSPYIIWALLKYLLVRYLRV